jgi:hypothetical protein
MEFKRIVQVLFGMTLLGLLSTGLLNAQGEATATPAPSKTATFTPITAATVQVTPSATYSPQTAIEPLTQADLSILTGNVQRPNGIAFFNEKLYTACNGDFTIYEIDSVTASTRTYIWGVRNAHTIYAENDELGELNLWAPDFQQNQLVRVDRNGVDAVVSELQGPWGIAYLDEDEFLVSNLLDDSVIVASRAGEVRRVLSDMRSPTGIATDTEHVYLANTGSARRAIEWLPKSEIPTTADAPMPTPRSLVSGLQNTSGMVMAEDGYLYFAYSLGTRGVVGRVNPEQCRENGCTNEQVEIVLYTELAAPLAGLAISPDMRLFVHTIFSPDIYWVQLSQ